MYTSVKYVVMILVQDRLKFESHLILKACQRKDEEILEVDDEGRLQCQQCERSYADVDSLTRHIAWKHKEARILECSECKGKWWPVKSSKCCI